MDRARRIERSLPGLFDELAEARTPDYLEAAIERASSRPQRPSWTFPARWLPMDLATTRVPSTRMPWRQLAVLALIALLLAAALALYVGSRPHLPAPYGIARNGAVTFVTPSGDIAIADPTTSDVNVIVGGPENDHYPTFSLDGTRVAFLRTAARSGETKVMIVDLRDHRLVEVADVRSPAGLLQWSPDGSLLTVESHGELWIAPTDGSGARKLDLGMVIQDEVDWRPPDGSELVFRGVRDGRAGLFMVGRDGSGLRPITPLDGKIYDYLWLTWSPDGKQLAYHKFPAREVHVMDMAAQVDRTIEGDVGVGMMFPRWSPDGTRLSVMTWLDEAPFVQVGVVPVNDPTPHVTLTGPRFLQGIQHDWSPDGTIIFAAEWGSSQPWLLDPDGGAAKEPAWDATFPDWIEWQRLTP
jgi:Tol biopolymer transport system component